MRRRGFGKRVNMGSDKFWIMLTFTLILVTTIFVHLSWYWLFDIQPNYIAIGGLAYDNSKVGCTLVT